MSNGPSRQLALIISAGASLDCGRKSQCAPEWEPPLVKHLFANRGTFNAIMNRYPGVNAFAHELRSRVESEGLETLLATFANSSNPKVQRQYRDVPLYLQEVLGDVSSNYIHSGGTAFNTLVRNVDDSAYTKSLYITVNYDLFLQQALAAHHGVSFRRLDDYTPADANWALIKSHGSVNWGRRVLNGGQNGKHDPHVRLSVVADEELDLGELEVLAGYKEAARLSDQFFCYPALSAPVRGKTQFVCDERQVTAAAEFLSTCTDFLFIGFSGLDDHVLKLLKGVTCVAHSLVVTKPVESATALLRRLADVNPLFGSGEVIQSISPGGFHAFVNEGQLGEFLRRARALNSLT
jgi:hypothetical protein